MRIYNFEVSGKLKLEENKGDSETLEGKGDSPEKNKDSIYKIIKVKIIEKLLDKIWEIIYTLFFILGLLIPEGSFLELLYRFHKVAIYSIIPLLIIKETFLLIRWVKAKKGKEEIKESSKLLMDMLIALLIFVILFVVNLGVYEKIVGPKLTTIEILSPKDRDEVSRPVVGVKVFVRNVELPIYLIVETPQGTQWIQAKRFIQHNKFKDTLTLQVYLGGGYIGIGEIFKIFAIGTKEDLPIGLLERIPPDAVHSNAVTVRRSG